MHTIAPSLEADASLAARVLYRAELAQQSRDDIAEELFDAFTKALTGKVQFLPTTQVRSERTDRGGLTVITTTRIEKLSAWMEEVAAVIKDDGAHELLREMLIESRCAHVALLRGLVTARVFRDLTDSVVSTFDYIEVLEALRDVLLHSACAQVAALRDGLKAHYILVNAPRVAEARGVQ